MAESNIILSFHDGRMRLAQFSTGLSRHELRGAAVRGDSRSRGPLPLVVYRKGEAARIANLSQRSLEREISLGRGPEVVQLSPRRVGITDAALRAWIERRTRPAPGETSTRATTT